MCPVDGSCLTTNCGAGKLLTVLTPFSLTSRNGRRSMPETPFHRELREETVQRLLSRLTAALARRSRFEDWVWDASVDALLAYMNRPETFDPRRGDLETFLTRIARRRLIDRERAESSRRLREHAFGEMISLTRREREERRRACQDLPFLIPAILDEIRSDTDRQALRSFLIGDPDLPGPTRSPVTPELQQSARRHLDRIRKRLQRLGDRLSHRPHSSLESFPTPRRPNLASRSE